MHAPTPSSKTCNRGIRMPDPKTKKPLACAISSGPPRCWLSGGKRACGYADQHFRHAARVTDLEHGASARVDGVPEDVIGGDHIFDGRRIGWTDRVGFGLGIDGAHD